jgi:hypothetical protein
MKKKPQKKQMKTRPKAKAKLKAKPVHPGNMIDLADRLFEFKHLPEPKPLSISYRQQTLHYANLLKKQIDDLSPYASPALNHLRQLTNEIISRNEEKTLCFQGKTYVVQNFEEIGYPSSGFKRVKIEAICRETEKENTNIPF